MTRLWRRIFRLDPRDEIDSELGHHLDERIREYIARGMTPDDARRAALERLGDLDRVRDECTDLLTSERRAKERRVRLNVSWLDVKLGLRMLAKYPGLSLVSVIGMAVAIAVGAGSFAVIDAASDPTLPLDGGDRIVSLQINRADEGGTPERRALHLEAWREELQSVRDLGAFRRDRRNLVTDDGTAALVRIAEMSASGFRVAGVSTVMGRTLLDEDERPGTPAVVVIGHEEWQRRFEAIPASSPKRSEGEGTFAPAPGGVKATSRRATAAPQGALLRALPATHRVCGERWKCSTRAAQTRCVSETPYQDPETLHSL